MVRTPENPRVKTVPLQLHNEQVTQPSVNVKWVSPQFSANTAQIRPKARRGILDIKRSKRTAPQPLQFDEDDDSPHISVYPSLAPHLVPSDPNQTTDMEQNLCQSPADQPVSSTDQEVPDLSTIPDVTTLGYSPSQTSLKDLNAPEMDEESHSNSMRNVSLGCTENMEELSEQVGCMSLEDNSHTTAMSTNCTRVNEEQLELSDSQFNSVVNDLSAAQGQEDVSTQNEPSCLTNSSHRAPMCDNLDKGKNNNATFKPPSTSTPYRLRDLSAPSQYSQFSKLSNSASKQPANSDFVLRLTNSSYQDDSNELGSYEVTDSSHTTCEECATSDDSSFILAVETPQHLWCSPEVKVIDNTFSK